MNWYSMTAACVLHNWSLPYFVIFANGKAVGREALIRDVWDHKYDVGNNVVDAVSRVCERNSGAIQSRLRLWQALVTNSDP